MGSCGNLASAAKPLSSVSEVAEELVSEELAGGEASLCSSNCYVGADQTSSRQSTHHSGIHRDFSLGHCDRSSLVVSGDDHCIREGNFEWEDLNKVNGSYLEEDGFSVEVCPENLQNADDMAFKVTSGIGSRDNPCDWIETDNGMQGDEALLKRVNSVKESVDDLLVLESSSKWIHPLIVTRDACHNELKVTLESQMFVEEVFLGQDGLVMNDQKDICHLATCSVSVEEKVHDLSEVKSDSGGMESHSEASGIPIENVRFTGYPYEKSRKYENKLSGIEIEACIDVDSHESPSNENDGSSDNSLPADCLCCDVPETVQEDDKSVKRLSSKEVTVEVMRETSTAIEVEAGTCIKNFDFQIIGMPMEEKNALLKAKADSNVRLTLFREKMPIEQSNPPDCITDSNQTNELESGVLLSGMPIEMFSGIEGVKIDDLSCQILPSKDDLGTLEGVHTSSILSSSSQMDGMKDSNGAPKVYLEHVKEGNVHAIGLQSCEAHSTVNCCSEKSSLDLDVPKMVVAAAATSIADNDYPTINNHEIKRDGGSECVPATKSSLVMVSSSRSNRVKKSGRKTQTKKASTYSKITKKVTRNYEALELIFKASKKKRTCFSKMPRSSTWGVMQNVSQNSEYINGTGIEAAQKQGPQKVGIVQGSGKQSINKPDGTSQPSKGNAGSSSNRIRLKVKMGKEIFMVSEVNGPASSGAFASARSGATSSNVAKLTNDIKEKNQLEHVNANRKSYHCDSLMNGDPILIAKESTQNGGGCLQVTHAEIGPVGVMTEDRYLSSGTSPDSEVVDLMPEAQIGERHQEIINTVALDSSKSLATCEDVLQTRKVKNKDKAPRQSSCRLKDKSLSGSLSSKRRTCKVKGGEKFDNGENALPFTIANHLSNSSRNAESVNVSCNSDLAFLNGSLCVEGGDNTYPDQDISIGSMDLKDEKNHFPSYEKMKGKKQVKSSKSGRVSSGISKGVKSTKSKKEYSCKQKKDSEKLTRKSKVKEKFVYNQLLCKTEDHSLTGNNGTDGDKKTKGASHTWIYDDSKSEITSNSLAEQQLPQPNAWVRCDDCYKWRRIAAALADSIADSNWICKDNLDKRFADCSIPQEMSNADINAELELSDYSCEDDYYDGNQNYKELKCSRPTVSQQSSFIQIDSNKFLHRSQRTQTIDEVMVCHCKPPLDGKLGCGDECLNRMLNIECVQGTCPCGDLCSNQQFQRRNYAKLQWFRCGRKGYGLQLLKDVSKGDFIIEYVGEVLDIPTYEERQRNYAANGHKHFYFMTLNGGEVIDACSKGNLGRFINHSCDPNCQTEKWMVNGEICIGLFAIRDIKKGEEVTFDYNYVRVFGAAAKKCVCGSPLCRGYIGGDLQSTETIVQGDSDDEFPEPIMLNEDGDVSYKFDNTIPVRGSDILIEDLPVKPKNEVIREVESTLGSGDPRSLSVPCISHPDKSLAAERRLEKALPSKPHEELSMISHDVITRPLSELQQNISMDEDASDPNPISTPEMNEPPGRSVSDEKRSMTELHYLVKVRRSNGTVKKSKGSGNLQNPNKGQGIASKSQMVSSKPKKAIEGTSNGRFEAVQEKLNELLDADGGISKRKDAPKGYLKLLLLTAASGDNNGNGEAIQSNRDLSMILDALLKTRSRVVLMDIISKNGLRMLHNILKQYRRDFKKIPILRKLLKVLEYLASRDILTLDHIIVGPPCPGMESLRESILSLTEHEDKQVHQIARSFRDRWIPRHLRKVGFADWDGQNFTIMGSQGNWQDAGLSRTSEAAACPNLPSISAPTSGATDSSSIDGGSSSGTRKPKRKTRWDSDTNPYLESLIKLKEKSADTVGDGKEGIVEEEGPPGFSSPLDTSGVSSNSSSTPAALDQSSEKDQYARCPFDAVIGQPQERFKSQLQVSYGVPLLILQCGVPQAGSKESWAIAPGMPFHPFPPLPPFPRERKRPCPSSSSDCETSVSTTVHSSAEEKQPENLGPCSYGASLAGSEAPYSENQQTMPNKRWKVSSQDMGRRYFRQQKWNGPKMPPPWVRNSWRNSNPRGGSGSCPGPYENAVDCKIGRDDSNYHQHMQQPNHH